MATTESASYSSAVLGQKSIEAASSQNKWLFAVYMGCVIGAAVLTFLLWQSSNRVQGAIVADANARIAEANSTAAQANERATLLEHDNLTLRTEQQRVQIELAKQREVTAKAEQSLLDLQRRVHPRGISNEQESHFLNLTRDKPKGAVTIVGMDGDPESVAFAKKLNELLVKAGWSTTLTSEAEIGYTRSGVFMFVRSRDPINSRSSRFHTVALSSALQQIGVLSSVDVDPGVKDNMGVLVVGHKV